MTTLNQPSLNEYFSTTWHLTASLEKYEKTGLTLVSKVKAGESVLDVGCGVNPFKGLIPNLIGIDPAFDQADLRCTIEEFDTEEKFDVAFVLGSINFGDAEDVERQIAKVVSLLKTKARIYWRCNPGLQDHPNEECKEIRFYPWTIEEQVRLADKFQFKLVDCSWDTGDRLYAEWTR